MSEEELEDNLLEVDSTEEVRLPADVTKVVDLWGLDGEANPRNPRHFDRFECGRKRLSDTFTHRNSGSEEHSHCFMHYFCVKTLSETLFPPPLMTPGYGARWRRGSRNSASRGRRAGRT